MEFTTRPHGRSNLDQHVQGRVTTATSWVVQKLETTSCPSWPSDNLDVVFNKSESEYKEISCGVPQGSILGPLLFILYINDIEHVSDIIKPILFADDTSLFHSHACFNTLIQEVNIQLHKFSTCFNTNKLSLNTKKSNFIIFTPNGKKYNISEAEININGSKIKHVKCTKFLGITIDEHLDWNVHIDNLSNKIARNVGV